MTLESKSTSSTKKKKSNNFDIYLASSSPRRAEILKNLKVNFEILKCDFDESNFIDKSPEDFVIKNTQQKCLAAHAIRQKKGLPNKPILTADTIVVRGRRILGKPKSRILAETYLELLSGCNHRVITAVCLAYKGSLKVRTVKTLVKMKRLSKIEINNYLDSEEWVGKAGGYAIQGKAAKFIPFISGSYTNIVGLPLTETVNLLLGNGFVVEGKVLEDG